MSVTAPLAKLADLKPAKRCPDYDADCRLVKDHYACWFGGERVINGEVYHTPQADGYCPFMLGLEKL